MTRVSEIEIAVAQLSCQDLSVFRGKTAGKRGENGDRQRFPSSLLPKVAYP